MVRLGTWAKQAAGRVCLVSCLLYGDSTGFAPSLNALCTPLGIDVTTKQKKPQAERNGMRWTWGMGDAWEWCFEG